jgi:hypothetical protein
MLVIILTAQRLAYWAHEDSYSTFFRVLLPLAHKLILTRTLRRETVEEKAAPCFRSSTATRAAAAQNIETQSPPAETEEMTPLSLFYLTNFPIFPKSYDPDVLRNWQYGSDHLKYPLPRKRSATTNRAYIYFLRNFTRIFFISTAQIRLPLTVPQLNGYDHLIFLLTRKTNKQTDKLSERTAHTSYASYPTADIQRANPNRAQKKKKKNTNRAVQQ